MQRLSSPLLSRNLCLLISTQRGTDPEQQDGTIKERRNSSGQRVRRLVHLSQFLPKDAETVRLEHFLFAFRRFRFLQRHWRGCGGSRDVHVDKRHVLHRLLHRGLGKSGNTGHTLYFPRDRGLRVFW